MILLLSELINLSHCFNLLGSGRADCLSRWAWKNSHLTRKIPDEQRITARRTASKRSKAGRVTKKVTRPPLSLRDQLPNLHLLLRVPGFARWPLGVRFFCEDVYNEWLKWSAKANTPLKEGVNIVCDFEPQSNDGIQGFEAASTYLSQATDGTPAMRRAAALDVSFLHMKPHVDIGQSLVAGPTPLKCACCGEMAEPENEMMTVCPKEDCKTPSHMACLSQRFLESELGHALPVRGACPKCGTQLEWVDLVKELTLRMRGEKEIERLMRQARRRSNVQAEGPEDLLSEDEDEDVSAEEDGSVLIAEDVVDEPDALKAGHSDKVDIERDLPNAASASNSKGARIRGERSLPLVIQDSDDWEGVEVLE